jgi:GTP-sensing pleiotropic transcriptional regulator CodY
MNVQLFTEQLNQLLQTDADHLEAVCDLLRVHTGASVCVEGHDGRVMVECLTEEIKTPVVFKTDNLVLRRDKELTEEEKLAASMAVCVCTLLLRHREGIFSAEKKRRAKAVRAIINSLSFSELEAATHVIKIIGEKNEGLLIAGHIADKLGFARSVVTGALRKLEGANLIETRSLGMKGTYIRVKDALLTEELAKL